MYRSGYVRPSGASRIRPEQNKAVSKFPSRAHCIVEPEFSFPTQSSQTCASYSRNLLSVICSDPVNSCWDRVHTNRPCPDMSVAITMLSKRLLSGISVEWNGVMPIVSSSKSAISVTNLAISWPYHIPSWQLVCLRSEIASRRAGGSRHFIAMR